MPNNSQENCSPASDSHIILKWTVHLAREHPAKHAASIIIALFIVIAGYWATGVLGSIAATFVMLGAMADFWFPVCYEISSDGARCKMLLKSSEIKWNNVKRCYLDDDGVKLSPLDTLSRRETFRGIYLRFSGNKDTVIETVKSLKTEQCKI